MNLDGDGAKACRSDGEDSTEAEAVEVGDVKGEDWEKPTFSLMSLSNEAHFIVFPEDRNMWLSSEPPKQKLKNPRSELPSKITNDRNLNLRNPRSQTDRPLQMQVSIEKTQRQRPRSDFYFTERRREKERERERGLTEGRKVWFLDGISMLSRYILQRRWHVCGAQERWHVATCDGELKWGPLVLGVVTAAMEIGCYGLCLFSFFRFLLHGFRVCWYVMSFFSFFGFFYI